MNKICFTTWIVFGCVLRATAFSPYGDAFNSRYATAGTRLDSCVVCHQGSNPNIGPPQSLRNPYGSAFEVQPHSGPAAIQAALASIESLDSDGDGVNNITEINNRTFPGDPNDPPPDTTAPSVSITTPPDGTSYTTPQTVTLQAVASDNVGVTKVDFTDFVSLVGTDTSAPYTFDWTFTSADNGLYTWAAVAYDAAGNSTFSVDVHLTVNIPPPDIAAPSVSITTPPDGTSYATSQTVTLQAAASDNVGVTKVEFYDGSTLRVTVPSAPYGFGWTITSADNGTHTWTARAYDAAGNQTSASVNLTVNIPPPDTAAPSVSITTPPDGTSYATSQTVTLQAVASDNVGVTKVEFYDGGTLRGAVPSAPYGFGWTITSADNGTHTWTARAYDAAGNQTSASVNLTVNIPPPDTAAPSVSITAPPDGTGYATPQTVTLQAVASDNVSVTKVEFYDGATLRGTVTSAPYTQQWTITSADNGTHTWTARAYDAAGNQTSASVNLTVNIPPPDTAAPSVSITTPPDGTGYATPQTVTLQAVASDNVGVTKVEFYDGATLHGTVTSTPYTQQWTITSADNGTHTWTARAYDAAGNQTSASVNLTVSIPPPDTAAPSISITTPPDGTGYGTPQAVTLQAVASDNVGVTKVEFYDGGTLRGTVMSAPYTQQWTITSADNGMHTWTSRAYDAAGNQTSATVNLTVNIPPPDTVAPSVSITTPPESTSYGTPQTVTLQAVASDNVGVTKVEFYDGGTLRGTKTSTPYSFDWTFGSADNGTHAWTARAYDAAGNTNTSPALNLTVNIIVTTVDVTPPTVALTAPANGTSYNAPQTVTLQADASDNVGVTKVEFYDGVILRSTDTSTPYSFQWTFGSVDNGSHAWTARAYDAAGNTNTSPALNLTVNIIVTTVDVTPPTVALTAPANGTSYNAPQTVTIQADASDSVGVTKVEFYDGGTLRGTDTSAPYIFDWMITAVDKGTNAWSARAYDAAGNSRTSDTLTLTVVDSVHINGAVLKGNLFSVRVATVKGTTYVLEWTRLLGNPIWNEGEVVVGDGTEQGLQDPGATSRTRFYRVRVDSP